MFAASDIGTPSPTPEPGGGTVAVVGDSISVGIVTPLATALGENYTVTGYGTGGAPVTSIVAQVTNNVAPSPRDYLVIIGGTADTRAQTGAAIASALGTDAVNEAAPSGATVVLCNLVAMGDNASGDPAARQAIIAAANVLINANQNADIVVDLYSNTVDEFDAQIGALFDLDTVHPNNAGDQLLAEVIAAAIEAG